MLSLKKETVLHSNTLRQCEFLPELNAERPDPDAPGTLNHLRIDAAVAQRVMSLFPQQVRGVALDHRG